MKLLFYQGLVFFIFAEIIRCYSLPKPSLPQDSSAARAYRSGIICRASGLRDSSETYFLKAETIAGKGSFGFAARKERIRLRIASGFPLKALGLIETTRAEYPDSAGVLDYWKSWALMRIGDFKGAAECLRDPAYAELYSYCLRVDRRKYYVTFAGVISYILPGACGLYSGRYFEGGMSLAWNALSAYFSLGAFARGRPLEGSLLAGLLWARFYRGNLQNSRKYEKEEKLKILNESLEYLRNNYKGQKP